MDTKGEHSGKGRSSAPMPLVSVMQEMVTEALTKLRHGLMGHVGLLKM